MAARGRARVRDRLRRARFPVAPGITATIERVSRSCAGGWPRPSCTCRRRARDALPQPKLAETYRRICVEARGGTREQEIERARELFYVGSSRTRSTASPRAAGCSQAATCARGRRRFEPPPGTTTRVHRLQDRPLGQGPVFLATGASRGLRPADMSPSRVRPHDHRVREARLRRPRGVLRGRRRPAGSPAVEGLQRRAPEAGRRDGVVRVPARPGQAAAAVEAAAPVGAGEPTLGDTVHLDVADRFGNLVSATPSGGWLHSSPTIPSLGWPLGTRTQMFWLEEGLPSSLAPRKRPRTTLSPRWRFGTASPTSPSARPAATSRISGRCTSSSALHLVSTSRPPSTLRSSRPTTSRAPSFPAARGPAR